MPPIEPPTDPPATPSPILLTGHVLLNVHYLNWNVYGELQVMRSGGTWTRLAEGTEYSYAPTQNGKYTYRVLANGVYSNEITLTRKGKR